MNPNRISSQTVLVSLICLATANLGLGQSPEKTSADTNPYVDRLKQIVVRYNDTIQKNKRDGRPESYNEGSRRAIERYERQIKLAEASIAGGKEFGKEELSAATKVILKEAESDHQQTMRDITEKAKDARLEANRKFDQVMTDARKKHAASTERSSEDFRIKTESANLLRKFQGSAGNVGIVVWNLPQDESLHQRSTTAINVRLLNGQKEVWNRKNLKLNRKQPRNPIRLPSVLFDTVAVDLVRWSGAGGGLAEIEVFIGKENVAVARPCDVSSIETLPIHLDDQNALTDGVTQPKTLGTGYWIPEEDAKATVTIRLLGKKVGSDPK